MKPLITIFTYPPNKGRVAKANQYMAENLAPDMPASMHWMVSKY